MAVSISIYLFGKPGVELDAEGEEIDAERLRLLGEELRDRMNEAADAVARLTSAGWDAHVALYDILLSHPYVRTEAEARLHVGNLGLDPDEFFFMEWEEEEWDEEDEGGEGEEWRQGPEG
jgi:hypothetical protein